MAQPPGGPPADEDGAWIDLAQHETGFARANGLQLHYLRWGRWDTSDPVLILIHGATANPHYFDDLAPSFTDRFRVLAYARRGHGLSDASEPYDSATLSDDLCGLMDALGISKAHLAGWSMGGNEVTAMAGAHPDRVDRLVYLDAAYDWADPASVAMLESMPQGPECPLSSLAEFVAHQRALMFPGIADSGRVEAFLRNLAVVQADGSVRSAMTDAANEAVYLALTSSRRDYTMVSAPALAIYAASFWGLEHGDGALRARNRDWETTYVAPFRFASTERIRRELRDVTIVDLPGTHPDLIFRCRDEVVVAMREFLLQANRPEGAGSRPEAP
ncbi:MAG: alpha/beta hydrolase [Thermoplasmata archaeon]|nr:alpha/beta hydrolase [Thermoplasmata archaeon]